MNAVAIDAVIRVEIDPEAAGRGTETGTGIKTGIGAETEVETEAEIVTGAGGTGKEPKPMKKMMKGIEEEAEIEGNDSPTLPCGQVRHERWKKSQTDTVTQHIRPQRHACVTQTKH